MLLCFFVCFNESLFDPFGSSCRECHRSHCGRDLYSEVEPYITRTTATSKEPNLR